jgi:hypothetical protein
VQVQLPPPQTSGCCPPATHGHLALRHPLQSTSHELAAAARVHPAAHWQLGVVDVLSGGVAGMGVAAGLRLHWCCGGVRWRLCRPGRRCWQGVNGSDVHCQLLEAAWALVADRGVVWQAWAVAASLAVGA